VLNVAGGGFTGRSGESDAALAVAMMWINEAETGYTPPDHIET